MANNILLSPPLVFMIIFFVIVVLSWLCSPFAFRRKGKQPLGADKAYACGEDFHQHMIQPDYSQFFPFAFFFTILHVVALVITTVPAETIQTFTMALVFIVGAVTGLIILLRK